MSLRRLNWRWRYSDACPAHAGAALVNGDNSDIMGQSETLTTNQRRALAALLASKSIREAADRVNLTDKTLHRYLKDPLFSAELAKLEGQMIGQGVRWLISEFEAVLGTIDEIRQSPEASPAEKLRAAKIWLDAVRDFRTDLEARLTRLEEAVYGKV